MRRSIWLLIAFVVLCSFSLSNCGQGQIGIHHENQTGPQQIACDSADSSCLTQSAADKLFNKFTLEELVATFLPRRVIYHKMDPSWKNTTLSGPFSEKISSVAFDQTAYQDRITAVIDVVDKILRKDLDYLAHIAPQEGDDLTNGGPLPLVIQRVLCLAGDQAHCPSELPDWEGRITGEMIAQLVCTDWQVGGEDHPATAEQMNAFWDNQSTLGADLLTIKARIVELWDAWEEASVKFREEYQLPIMFPRTLPVNCLYGPQGDSTGLEDEEDFWAAIGRLAGFESVFQNDVFEYYLDYLPREQLQSKAAELLNKLSAVQPPLEASFQNLVESVDTMLSTYPELITYPGLDPNSSVGCNELLNGLNDLWHNIVIQDYQRLLERLLKETGPEKREALVAQGIAQYRRILECGLEKVAGIGNWSFDSRSLEYTVNFPESGDQINIIQRLGLDYLSLEVPLMVGAADRMLRQEMNDKPQYSQADLQAVFGDLVLSNLQSNSIDMPELEGIRNQLNQSSWGRSIQRLMDMETWKRRIETGLNIIGVASLVFSFGGGRLIFEVGKKVGWVAIEATISKLVFLKVAGIGLLATTSRDLINVVYFAHRSAWGRIGALYPNTPEGLETFQQDQYRCATDVLRVIGDSLSWLAWGHSLVAQFRAQLISKGGNMFSPGTPITLLAGELNKLAPASVSAGQFNGTFFTFLNETQSNGLLGFSIKGWIANNTLLGEWAKTNNIKIFTSPDLKPSERVTGSIGGEPAVIISSDVNSEDKDNRDEILCQLRQGLDELHCTDR